MWIPHRVFFANLAFVVAVTAGVLLLVCRPVGWRRWVEAVAAPVLALGAFIGMTATRGMPLRWLERVEIALWVSAMTASWLVGAAVAIALVRRSGCSRVLQVAGGGAAAGLLFVLTRLVLRR